MPWQNLILTASAELAEALESRLMAAGALSVTLGDAGDAPVLEPGPGETPLWPEIMLTALFTAEADLMPLAVALQTEYALAQQPRTEALPDQDWIRAWMDDFKPMRFGKRVWVCPSWCEPPEPEAVNLRLDPGLAFGTGTHPTTSLCLQWLDGHLQPGGSVLDYGCGSGILAIAALKLGAQEAWAVDIDPQALTATRDNARRNDIDDTCLHIGQPEARGTWQADLVIANILSGPLIALADVLCDCVKPGGHLLLSGILATQADATANAYAGRIDWEPPAVHDGWVRLSGRRDHDA
ncbi:ribosomal protein L11 methyltransferase [Acidihalobacter yilgarnensis]|uniref:Ribosomal protein L11 methyltransferase n=1 Tax=Acidihalobacter yilgarnensis TaxID=2819280 RepID=A0A1D8IKQ7_9GAMM|nr:50S ribosomal protein L11 methyltransferase [Acidihalobacter yilgarnensis]AOU97027.1 ribosomal protein L11 methyltransferase [Acidihalobacter yilgarnensis]